MTLERPETSRSAGRAVEAAFPLAPLQEGMLYHALRTPDAGLYHGRAVVQLEGPLSAEQFQEAWRLAAQRHEAFRTAFAWERRERPVQVMLSEVTLDVEFVDWTALPEADRSRQREALLQGDRDTDPSPGSNAGMYTGIHTGRAPMMRWVVAQLGPDAHELLWSFNHAVLDGWSALLLLNEVLEDYDDLIAGRPLRQRPQPPSYARFVSWMAGRNSAEARAFWTRALQGVQHATPVPAPDGAGQSTERTTTDGWLSEGETVSLRTAAAGYRVTTNTMVVAAWGIVLGRHAGTDDVVTGMTLSERPHELPGVERAAGLYLSTIPIRVHIGRNQGVGPWLRRTQAELTEARAHSGPSLADIQRWSGIAGEALIRSLVVFESFPEDVASTPAHRVLTARSVEISGPSDLPIALLALPGNRLRLQLVHDPARISPARASTLLDELRATLVALCRSGETGVGEVLALLRTDRAPAPDTLPGIGPALAAPAVDVVDLFETAVKRTPDAVAIRTVSEAVTYQVLDNAAGAVGRRIQSAGLAPGSLIGLLGGRSADTIAAMLGTLKAHCAYAPLDPALPPARLTAMAGALDAVLVLDGFEDLVEQWPVTLLRWGRADVGNPSAAIADEVPADVLAHDSADRFSAHSAPADRTAYVIHTSGSTGAPKGVMVSREQLAWSTAARFAYYGTPPGAFLLLSSLAVDSSVAGVYWTLCGGGTLVLPSHGGEQDVAQLAQLIASERVTDTLLVPSLYRELLEAGDLSLLTSLRRVVVAGEACPGDLVPMHRTRLPGAELHNEYGPSEATVWATADHLTAHTAGPVTIGRPVALSRVYLVDQELRLVPQGDVGEILLGGPGVAMGYLGQAELTTQRFLADPWHAEGRVYRTGDRARWHADGRLEFLGRADDQIKIRGFRVEPVEVETALQAHPGVAEALVGLTTHGTSAGQLIALLQCASDAPSIEALDAFLRDRLPQYMIPSRMLVVDRLPRTVAGKLDRSGMHDVDGVELGRTQRSVTAPRTETERTLIEIWKGVLGVETIGIHDDFFEIGGDSLLSIRAISRAARAGVPVSPASFFAGPTIAQIATAATGTAAGQHPVTGVGHLTPIQRWFFEQFAEAPHHWNQAFLIQPARPLAAAAVERAVAALVVHHDALRQRFENTGGAWRPIFADPSSVPPVLTVKLTEVTAEQREARMLQVADDVHAGLNLEAGDLFRVVLFDAPDGDQRVLLLAHHLVVDALSWSIIFDDFASLLARDSRDGREAASAPALPAKTRSVLEWSDALHTAAAGPDVAAMSSLWTTARDGWGRVPRDLAASVGDNRTSTARHHVIRLSAELTSTVLDTASRPAGDSVQELALAALLLAWEQWTGQSYLQLDLEAHGRDVLGAEFDVSRTVGWFTCVCPIRLELLGGGATAALASVRKALPGSGLRKASYGLLRYLHPDPALRQRIASLPGSGLLFNYLGSLDGMIDMAAPFVQATHSVGRSRGAGNPRAYVLEINSWIEAQRLTFDIEYSNTMHTSDSMTRFGDALLQGMRTVSAGPGDRKFELAGLDESGVARLADLLADLDAG